MEYNSAWKANSSTVSQETPHTLWKMQIIVISHIPTTSGYMFLCTPRNEYISWIISPTGGVCAATSAGYTSVGYFSMSCISNVWVCVATSVGNVSMSNVRKMWVSLVTLARYVLRKSAEYVFARISSMRFGYMKIIVLCWCVLKVRNDRAHFLLSQYVQRNTCNP